MSWIPAPLVQPPEGDNRTYITAALPPDMVAKLEQVLDIAKRTHPRADVQGLIDMVMCAGITAVSSDSYTAIGTACAQRDTYRAALRKIHAESGNPADRTGKALTRVEGIAAQALRGDAR